jgi:hypothetical protein
MEDWQREWQEKLAKTAAEIDKFWQEVGDAAESFVDEISDTVEDFVDRFQEQFVSEVDRYVQDFIDEIAETSQQVEASLWEDWQDFVEDTDFVDWRSQEASVEHNPACIGCCHYHGQIYNGNLLVCGMHPYGWDGETCPDWEDFRK